MRLLRAIRSLWRGVPIRHGLGRRILLWFLALSLVPLLVSNTVGYLVSKRIIESQVHRYLNALSEVEARHVASEMERHQLYLDAVAAGNNFLFTTVPEASAAIRDGRRQDPTVTALHEHLDRKLAELRPLTELFVFDTAGLIIAATGHDRVGSTYARTERNRVSVLGVPHHSDDSTRPHGETESDPHAHGPDGEVFHELSSPIVDGDGRQVGTLTGTVVFDRLQAFLRMPPHLAGDVHSFVVDERGRPVVISHLHTPIDFSRPLPSPVVDAPVGSVLQYVNYEGVEVLGTAVTVPGYRWRYIAEVSVASAFGELRSLALLAGGLQAVFALLLVGVVWFVASWIIAPLHRLVTAAERIRSGELGVEVQINRDDEIGHLGRTFNQMSAELQRSARRLQELHEREMRRAAQLASVGELASGIAHEIKNPLVGAASGLDLVSRRISDDPSTAGIVQQIRLQLRRIESAIRDLLSYARPKDPRRAHVDPSQLLDRAVTLIRPQADAAGVRVEKAVPAAPVPRLRVDPEQMTQALVNLALNGIQAMDRDGVLRLGVASTDEEIRISITDTGPGIAEDRVERIFRPFFTTKHEGTGLGLAITRGIVERHGGRLEVDSAPGRGSTFTLVFEVTETEAIPL